MRTDRLLRVVAAALTALVLLPAPARAEDTADGPTPLTGAVLRWGMSNEANNKAPNGDYNFFSAGRIAAPVPAGSVVKEAGWKQSVGNVALEKWNGTAYAPATWAGRTSDSTGTAIPSFLSGRYSGHQFVFSKGTGTVDLAAGTASISWKGDVSVLFYGGLTYFYVADPTLTVADGTGTLTGLVSGLGASRDDPSQSVEVPPSEVVLATLPDVDLGDLGFTATPAYDGVQVSTEDGPVTDSFPQSFVTKTEALGTGAFWHRSGSSLDAAKKALPVTVSYDDGDPVDPVAPPTTTPVPEVHNDAPDPPKVVTKTVIRTAPAAAPAPVAAPPAPVAAPAPAAAAAPLTTSEVVSLVAAHPEAAPSDPSPLWWLGGGLFLLAGLVVLGALVLPSPVSPRALA